MGKKRPTALMLCLVLGLSIGCAKVPKRTPIPSELGQLAHIQGMNDLGIRRWGDSGWYGAIAEWDSLTDDIIRERYPALFDTKHTYVAISGGGANGAFAAGLLYGWTESGTRPEFSLVTGISTGALIAPYAFLGSDYDEMLKTAYTTVHTKDILKKRNKIKMLTGDAAASSEPLQEQIAKTFDEEVMEKVAAEYKRGRQLFIGTTHLDAGRPMVWNIGRIAASGHPGSLELIHKIMLASASIPGAFPPVLIPVEADGDMYDELHVDGGVASQVFLYPAGVDWTRVTERLQVPEPPEVFIIRNSKLDPVWKTTKNKLFPLSGRAVASLIRTQGIGDLYRIYLEAQRDGLRFNLAHIPGSFNETKDEQFDPEYMTALFEAARELAKNDYPWLDKPPELTLPDQAPGEE